MVTRELSAEETKKLRSKLERKLLSTVEKSINYWYPLFPVYKSVPVIAFDTHFIAKVENIKKIRNILIKHNISTVIELPEFENASRIEGFTDEEYFLAEDDDGITLPYMSECFWFDQNEDWIMYASHEFTIAFGGEWLVNEIREQLDNYSNHEIKNFI